MELDASSLLGAWKCSFKDITTDGCTNSQTEQPTDLQTDMRVHREVVTLPKRKTKTPKKDEKGNRCTDLHSDARTIYPEVGIYKRKQLS